VPGETYVVPDLDGSDGKCYMFGRKEMSQVEMGLNKDSDYVLQGPPGIGKSLLIKAFCIRYHFAEGKDVCYVQQGVAGAFVTVVRKVKEQLGVQYHCELSEWTAVALSSAITQISPEVSMVVVDGIRAETFKQSMVLASRLSRLQRKQGITCQLFFVTSQQVDFSKGHEMGLQHPLIRIKPSLVSWTLEEFEQACKNKHLWDKVAQTLGGKYLGACNQNDKIEALKEKYFYCGGSARWMFGFQISEIQKIIDDKVEELYDFKPYLTASAGVSSPLAVNTLYQQYSVGSSSKRFLLSKYVIRRVIQKNGCETANFLWNLAVASRHPPLRGLAFEGKCIAAWRLSDMNLTLTHLDTLLMKPNNIVEISRKRVEKRVIVSNFASQEVLDLDKDDKLVCTDPGPRQQNICIIPEAWNQACFDFVVIQDRELYCMQCTLKKQHSRSIQAIGNLIKQCRDHSITVEKVHLVALTDKDKCKFEKPKNFAAGIDMITCWWAPYTQ
jgi:hypothetical protein